MTKTRRLWVSLSALLLLFALGYRTPKNFNPGVYVLSEKTDTAPFVEVSVYPQEDTIYSVAPKEIKVDIQQENIKKYIYGSFELGNLQQKVYYVATVNKKDDIEGLYVDLNRDGTINDLDWVLLYINQEFKDGTRARQTNDPLRILVDYRTASNIVIHKYLSFNIMVLWHPQSGIARTAHWVASWFAGELHFIDGKKELPVKIAILDGDSDGIFNDFNKNKDMLVADVNYNGKFEKNEITAFGNLFEMKGEDRTSIQYRNYVFPWPYRLAILPVSEWKNSTPFEPSSDGDPPLAAPPASNEKAPQK